MNFGASTGLLPESISEPPNQSTTTTAIVPRNSLIGWARAMRRAIMLLWR